MTKSWAFAGFLKVSNNLNLWYCTYLRGIREWGVGYFLVGWLLILVTLFKIDLGQSFWDWNCFWKILINFLTILITATFSFLLTLFKVWEWLFNAHRHTFSWSTKTLRSPFWSSLLFDGCGGVFQRSWWSFFGLGNTFHFSSHTSWTFLDRVPQFFEHFFIFCRDHFYQNSTTLHTQTPTPTLYKLYNPSIINIPS